MYKSLLTQQYWTRIFWLFSRKIKVWAKKATVTQIQKETPAFGRGLR